MKGDIQMGEMDKMGTSKVKGTTDMSGKVQLPASFKVGSLGFDIRAVTQGE